MSESDRLVIRPVHAGVLLLLTVACGEDGAGPLPAAPSGYPYAYATNSCGPADGPATRFYLASEPSATLPATVPRIEFVIHQPHNHLHVSLRLHEAAHHAEAGVQFLTACLGSRCQGWDDRMVGAFTGRQGVGMLRTRLKLCPRFCKLKPNPDGTIPVPNPM